MSKEFSYNWDYIQSCFFSLTILTTIMNLTRGSHHGRWSGQLDLPGSGGQSASADFPIDATTWRFLQIFILPSYFSSSSKKNTIDKGGGGRSLDDNHRMINCIG